MFSQFDVTAEGFTLRLFSPRNCCSKSDYKLINPITDLQAGKHLPLRTAISNDCRNKTMSLSFSLCSEVFHISFIPQFCAFQTFARLHFDNISQFQLQNMQMLTNTNRNYIWFQNLELGPRLSILLSSPIQFNSIKFI